LVWSRKEDTEGSAFSWIFAYQILEFNGFWFALACSSVVENCSVLFPFHNQMQ